MDEPVFTAAPPANFNFCYNLKIIYQLKKRHFPLILSRYLSPEPVFNSNTFSSVFNQPCFKSFL